MITVVMITVMVVEPDDGSVAFTHGFYDTGGFVKKKIAKPTPMKKRQPFLSSDVK